jgi:hypothetical protein
MQEETIYGLITKQLLPVKLPNPSDKQTMAATYSENHPKPTTANYT